LIAQLSNLKVNVLNLQVVSGFVITIYYIVKVRGSKVTLKIPLSKSFNFKIFHIFVVCIVVLKKKIPKKLDKNQVDEIKLKLDISGY
jgi:hypothetical protein